MHPPCARPRTGPLGPRFLPPRARVCAARMVTPRARACVCWVGRASANLYVCFQDFVEHRSSFAFWIAQDFACLAVKRTKT